MADPRLRGTPERSSAAGGMYSGFGDRNFLSPQLAERFELLGTLGQGGSGVVYLVRDLRRGGKELALKVLEFSSELDDHTIERFREEVKVCSQIRHPNLIRAYDLFESDGELAYSMEYVDGSSLSSTFECRPFSDQEIDTLLEQVLSALQALHSHGILHRDVKMENVLLNKDGSAKLTDLGLMKQYRKGFTENGILLGTAQYFPPEYIRSGRFDARSDIYAVGIMLYEFLRGERYLSQMPGEQVIDYLIKRRFHVPLEFRREVSRRHLFVLERSLNKDPRKRFQAVWEMMQAIRGTSVEIPVGVSSSSFHAPLIKDENGEVASQVDEPLTPSAARKNRLFSQLAAFTILAAIAGLIMVALATISLSRQARSTLPTEIGGVDAAPTSAVSKTIVKVDP